MRMSVGEALHMARRAAKMTQEQLYQKSSVSTSMIAQVEAGNRMPSQAVVDRLVTALRTAGVSEDILSDIRLDGTHDSATPTTPAPVASAPTAGDGALTPPPFAPANMALLVPVPSAGGWWLRLPKAVPDDVATKWANEAQQYVERYPSD